MGISKKNLQYLEDGGFDPQGFTESSSLSGKPLDLILPLKELYPGRFFFSNTSQASVSSSEPEPEINTESHTTATESIVDFSENDIIQKVFHESRSQWIDDPVIAQWRNPSHRVHRVMADVNKLYHDWASRGDLPFAFSPYPLWLSTGRALSQVGLPWHNNQVNLPKETDSSWPFHFKEYETQAIQLMGSRVGDKDPSGYMTSYNEANCYCIRALQQELRATVADRKPILVYDHFDAELIKCFESFFGLETLRVDLSMTLEELQEDLQTATSHGERPIIFSATIGNSATEYDDLGVITELSRKFPILLHVDSFRSFDYITMAPESDKDHHGMERLQLALKLPNQPLRAEGDNRIIASTIVAGGLAQSDHAPAVALKPMALGGGASQRVSYIRSFDSTLGGSRDAIAPLWLAMYELRLQDEGLQDLFHYLVALRGSLLRGLCDRGIPSTAPPYCLDVVVQSCAPFQKQRLLDLGGTLTREGKVVLAVQPQLTTADVSSFLDSLDPWELGNLPPNTFPLRKDFEHLYPLPPDTLNDIEGKVRSWKIMTRSTAGYPLHMGSLSALGPVLGRFWDLKIPKAWVEKTARELMASRLQYFGVQNPEHQKMFKSGFTNGSTMANRSGIHSALAQYPGAFVYLSTETHYSVAKALRDCDTVTNIWSGGQPRYSKIPCNSDGSILVDALVRQALEDRKRCQERDEEYRMVIFANIGTTFVGARDDLAGIYRGLQEVGIEPSHIHVDGAFDCGFDSCGVKLGPPGVVDSQGMPLVQGVTLSHHKAWGQNVSGEVHCFSPNMEVAGLGSPVDPMVVFETWLYNQVIEPTDMQFLLKHCCENAVRLESGLKRRGLAAKRNPGSTIVVLERPPSWMVEDLSLRPEGDWVHYVTMPSISKEIIDLFLYQLESVDKMCSVAFSCVAPQLSDVVGRPVQLKRITCQSALAKRVTEAVASATRLEGSSDEDLNGIARRSLRGAISVAAVDQHDQIQVVILADSRRDHSIQLRPLLIKSELSSKRKQIANIVEQVLGLMGTNLKAKVFSDETSRNIYAIE